MRVAVAGALLLGGALMALLASSYNGQWLVGLLAMVVGAVGLYAAAEDPPEG